MALLLGALTANAQQTQAGANIYFDGTGWTNSCVQLMFGHNSYSAGYAMTKIANTNIYHVTTSYWGDRTQSAIFGTSGVWGGENNNITHRKPYADRSTAIITGYDLYNGSSYVFVDNGATANYEYIENGYNSFNKTQKVEVLHDGDNLSGAATLSSYKLSGVKASAAVNGTEIAAAQTATVTCVATVEDGTCFEGWYEGETLVSENATYTYVVTGEKTLIAKFAYDPATAIESVEAASAAVEYYNLQGVKVANPEKGIFIKKAGNKTTKVIL